MLKKIILCVLIIVTSGFCSARNNNSQDIKKIEIKKDNNRFDINATYELKVQVKKPRNENLGNNNVSWKVLPNTESSQETILEITKTDKDKCYVKFNQKGKVKIEAQVGSIKDTIVLRTRSNNRLWSIIVMCIISTLCYYAIKIKSSNSKKKSERENTKELECNIKEPDKKINNLTKEKTNLENKYNETLKKYKGLVGEYNKLVDDYNKLRSKYISIKNNKEIKPQIIPRTEVIETKEVPKKKAAILYSDFVVDGFFNKVTSEPNDDTVFELHIKDNYADILIYDGAKKRIIANPAYLDGCECQIIGNHNIDIEEKGVAQKQINDKWKVIKVLKVVIK